MNLPEISNLISKTTALVLKKDPSLAEIISANFTTIYSKLKQCEEELSEIELRPNFDNKEIEEELLELNKKFERLQDMFNRIQDSQRRQLFQGAQQQQVSVDVEIGNHEVLQLQNRLIDQQDRHLEQLAGIVARHKIIGEQIGNELDSQVELLEDLNERTEYTQVSLNRTNRHLEGFLDSSESGACKVMVALFIVLIVIVIITRII